MNHQRYHDLVTSIDRESLVSCLKTLISIKSENPFDAPPREDYREQEVGEYYLETMRSLGLEVEMVEVLPGRPNAFGYLRGEKDEPSLMLAGHLDTARTVGYADAYPGREVEGKVFGRGACDMKAALAAYLEVVRILNAADVRLKGTLILAGLMDEEYQMRGAQHVGVNGPHTDYGIMGEPTELTICPASKGRVSTIIQTFGKAAHSSVPEDGENAIIYMSAVIQALARYNQDLLAAQSHPLLGHGRFNPGVIRGGSQVNTVPDFCELEVDRRTLPGENQEQVYQELRAYLEPLKARFPGLEYQITEPTWLIPALDLAHDKAIVQALLTAYSQVMEHPTQVRGFVAGTDAPHLGFPTVVCGPGSIAQAHTTNEFVSIPQLEHAVQLYLHVVLDLLECE